MSKELVSKITFEKRVYHIEIDGDTYEVTCIFKHDIEEYDYKHIASVLKYETFAEPQLNGFYRHVASEEITNEILKLLNLDKDECNNIH
tara:strand:+ start:734 stop:1000 length:267 start_codon:yes stop_codon:yes gene_type:complete